MNGDNHIPTVIWEGISSDIRLEIFFYGSASHGLDSGVGCFVESMFPLSYFEI